MSEENPLEFIDTDDLIDELHRRYDAGVIMFATHVSHAVEADKSSWWGGVAMVGLAELLRHRVIAAWFNQTEENGEPYESIS